MKPAFVFGCLPILLAPPALAATSPSSTKTAGAALIESARPAIEAANNEWLPAMRAHDASKIVEPYSANASFILENGHTVHGRAAILHMYESGFAKPGRVVSGDLVEDGLTAAGNLIYEWGHARVVFDRDGKTAVSAGKYLTVWQRGPSGKWLIIRNLVF